MKKNLFWDAARLSRKSQVASKLLFRSSLEVPEAFQTFMVSSSFIAFSITGKQFLISGRVEQTFQNWKTAKRLYEIFMEQTFSHSLKSKKQHLLHVIIITHVFISIQNCVNYSRMSRSEPTASDPLGETIHLQLPLQHVRAW